MEQILVGFDMIGKKPFENMLSRYSFVLTCVSNLSKSTFISPMIIHDLFSRFAVSIISCKF